MFNGETRSQGDGGSGLGAATANLFVQARTNIAIAYRNDPWPHKGRRRLPKHWVSKWLSLGLPTSQINSIVHFQSIPLGVLETSWNVRDLLDHKAQDVRAVGEITLLLYRMENWPDSFAAPFCGLDTLAFASGIGENTPTTRAQICEGPEFRGIGLGEARSVVNGEVISTAASLIRSAEFARTKDLR